MTDRAQIDLGGGPSARREVARAGPEARISIRDHVAIMELEDLSDPLPAVLVHEIEALLREGPLVVDLSDLTLISSHPVEGLAAWLVAGDDDEHRSCLVCSRGTARALLGRWHVTRALAVFASTGDALQARAHHLAGYGSGWRPDPLDTLRSNLRRPTPDHPGTTVRADVEAAVGADPARQRASMRIARS